MNIGETDADGWTYVRFGDAALAKQDDTHEVQGINVGDRWVSIDDGARFFCDGWQYRIRNAMEQS